MALTDLKKKSQPHGKSGFTADEFIDDANNYAMGMPRIVSLRLPDADDTPPAALLPAALNVAHYGTSTVTVSPATPVNSQFLTRAQARAPPLFSSR